MARVNPAGCQPWLVISPEGHHRGSPFVERQIVYVAQTADGTQQTLPPAEFAKSYGWQNDPANVKLLAP